MKRRDSELLTKFFGDDFDTEETPETMAFDLSLDFSTSVLLEMEKQGVSLKSLAEKIGVRPSTLSEKLNGKSNLTLKSMAEIACALNCFIETPSLIPQAKACAQVSQDVSVLEHKAQSLKYTFITKPIKTQIQATGVKDDSVRNFTFAA